MVEQATVDRREYIAAWREAHREELRAYQAAYRASHREKIQAYQTAYNVTYREAHPGYDAAYRADHQQERAAYNRSYAAAHREQLRAYEAGRREYSAAYYVTHREEYRARVQIYRARMRGLPSERVLTSVLFERDGGICGVCHKQVDKDASDRLMRPSHDHVLPVSHGGANTYANSRLTHLKCNIARGNRGAAQLRFI